MTELEKASGKQYQLIVMGGLSGRLDHTIHTVHALTELLGTRGNTTWVVGAESVACVLGPVRNYPFQSAHVAIQWVCGGAGVARRTGGAVGGGKGDAGTEAGRADVFRASQGKHDTTTSLDWFGPTCGILPIGQEAKVTTSGLVWNLGPTACKHLSPGRDHEQDGCFLDSATILMVERLSVSTPQTCTRPRWRSACRRRTTLWTAASRSRPTCRLFGQ